MFPDRNCRGSLGSEKINPRSEPAMKSIIKSFCKDESGATAIEYGLIAAGIAIAIITAVNGVGSQLSTNFNTISNSLK
jgi:pilus assembly protein Flp/PilA